MSDSKFARQMIGELPSLVAGKVIDANNAESLRRHYEPQIQQPRSLSIGLTISAVLGALLIGAGIILLLAHNWDELTRPMRAVVSMLPLVISVLVAGFALWKRPDSTAWREAGGMFYFLSIGASIALVSQTYHLYNDMAAFLFAWMLLTLPLIYLLGAGVAFIGYLGCVVGYNFVLNDCFRYHAQAVDWNPFYLLLAALPFYGWQLWRRRRTLMVTWTSVALAIALPLMLMVWVEDRNPLSWQMTYGLLFTLYYAVACRCFGDLRGWRNPFRVFGCLGIAVLAMVLTFRDSYMWRHMEEVKWLVSFSWIWLLGILAIVVLAGEMLWRRISCNWLALLFPVLLTVSVAHWLPVSALLLMNAYVLALGVFTLVRGVKRDSLLSMNEGMLLVAVLVLCRFFDDDYGFVVRGVAFIVIGLGFLGMNLGVLFWRRNKKVLSV